MPTYQIEMLWTCRICKFADNRGLHKHCNQCGKPKEALDVERFPDDISESNALEGEDVRKALAGPDWRCKYCNTLQNSLGRCCAECGADKNTGSRDWAYKGETKVVQNVETGKKDVTGRTVPRPNPRKPRIDVDLFRNPPKTEDLVPQHDAIPPPSVQSVSAQAHEFVPDTGGYRTPPKVRVVPIPWRVPSWAPKLGASFTIAGLAFLILWLLFRTRTVDATVSSVAWQHDVLVDRYKVFYKEGWDSDPGAFNIRDEGRRIHHYDHVQVGSHQESYQESYSCGQTCTTVRGSCYTTSRTCTSNKNGTATCTGGDRVCSPDTQSCSPKTCYRTAYRSVPDYEEQPRYRTWYSWKVWDWGYNRTVRASGTTLETRWPGETEMFPPDGLQDGERERTSRKESYTVTFSDSKESWTIRPSSEEGFKRFPPGSRFKLKVGVANGVTVLASNGSSQNY